MQSLIAALITAALVFIQCYISGTRLAYSLPAYAVIGLAAVLSLFSASEARRQISRVCMFATALCFTYLIARASQSPVEYLARADIYSILGCLAVYGLTAANITHRHLRSGLIAVLLGLAVIQAMMGVFQYADRPEWLPFNLVHPGAAFRGRGSFISSIHFAGYLEAIAPFGLAFAFWGSRTLWVRIMAGSVAVLAYFAIGLSGSRGAWLSSAFSLLVFAGISLNASRKVQRERFPAMIYVTVLAVIALPIGIYYLMQQSVGVRTRMDLLEKIKERKINEYDIRILNWEAAVDQWKLSPWTGTGAGTHLYYGRLFRRPGLQPDPIHAHSDYLELLAEYGIYGAIGVSIFLLAHFWSGARGNQRLLALRYEDPYRSSPELALNIGALTAASAYLAHSAVDFNLHLPGNALVMAFVFGLLANPSTPERKHTEESSPIKLPWLLRPAIPLLGLTLLAIAFKRFPSEYWESRARIAVLEQRYEDAIANARQALGTESKNPFIFYTLGEAHRRHSLLRENTADLELREAERAFRSALSIFKDDEFTLIRLGQTLDSLSEFRSARQAYQNALALDPNLGVLYGYYARHLQRVGRPEEAKVAYERGQQLTALNLAPFMEDPFADTDEKSIPAK